MLGRPKQILTPEQQRWIEGSFALLASLFGEEWMRAAPLVLPNDQFFPRKYEPTEDWGRYAFDRVCELMHVPPEDVDLAYTRDHWAELRDKDIHVGPTSGAAGLYHGLQTAEGTDRSVVAVKVSLLNDPESMVGVMSHELAHVLLLGGGKIPHDIERMEPLTDLMTVFSGFGIFTANAAFVHKSSARGWRVYRVGYLSQEEFAYSLALFAWLRGETKPQWSQELSKNVRTYMESTLKLFRASRRPMTILP